MTPNYNTYIVATRDPVKANLYAFNFISTLYPFAAFLYYPDITAAR